jgi:peptidoglycan/LPS O-acetylase OafA/YrhL
VFLLALFALCWSIGPQQGQFPVITVYYLYAYLAFGAAYLARDAFRPARLLDFLADISYPLYITHSLIGFALLMIALHAGLAFPLAVALVLTAVIALSAKLFPVSFERVVKIRQG